jgi:hypothetical protein
MQSGGVGGVKAVLRDLRSVGFWVMLSGAVAALMGVPGLMSVPLVVAFVCSNTKDHGDIESYLASTGQPIPEEALSHISPLGSKHIMLTGQYSWDKPKHPRGNGLLLPKKNLFV